MDAVRVVVVDLPAVRARALELQVLAIHAVADAEDFVLEVLVECCVDVEVFAEPLTEVEAVDELHGWCAFSMFRFADAALRPVPS